MDEEGVQYMLKKSVTLMESIPVPNPMSPRTALLAGLVLGVTVMIGIAGALAWRDKEQAYETKLSGMAVDAGAAHDAGR